MFRKIFNKKTKCKHEYREELVSPSSDNKAVIWRGYKCKTCGHRKTKTEEFSGYYLLQIGLERKNNWEDFGLSLSNSELEEYFDKNCSSVLEHLLDSIYEKKLHIQNEEVVNQFYHMVSKGLIRDKGQLLAALSQAIEFSSISVNSITMEELIQLTNSLKLIK